jgi:Cu(I)-responsive transcriptional regulator
MPSKEFSIGDMARIARTKVQTIRYYEDIGLMPAPARTEGNQRRYSESHLDRLAFIRHARELGFSVEAIRSLLDLYDKPASPCDVADRIASDYLSEVESKIKRLQSLKKELNRMIKECKGGRAADCRIIEVLKDHDHCLSGRH